MHEREADKNKIEELKVMKVSKVKDNNLKFVDFMAKHEIKITEDRKIK